MPKTRLTKNELKAQRENLKRFQRFLPTLQLKKQQLQLEVRRVHEAIVKLDDEEADRREGLQAWLPVIDPAAQPALQDILHVTAWQTDTRNIAGTDIPVHVRLTFANQPCDLFATPVWFDDVLAVVEELAAFALQRDILQEQLTLLSQELRVTSQRVNLFEKVKIPEAEENIRIIQIHLGDQLANAVGRAKLAKVKCRARDLTAATDI